VTPNKTSNFLNENLGSFVSSNKIDQGSWYDFYVPRLSLSKGLKLLLLFVIFTSVFLGPEVTVNRRPDCQSPLISVYIMNNSLLPLSIENSNNAFLSVRSVSEPIVDYPFPLQFPSPVAPGYERITIWPFQRHESTFTYKPATVNSVDPLLPGEYYSITVAYRKIIFDRTAVSSSFQAPDCK
jgi:hypothetical protein